MILHSIVKEVYKPNYMGSLTFRKHSDPMTVKAIRDDLKYLQKSIGFQNA